MSKHTPGPWTTYRVDEAKLIYINQAGSPVNITHLAVFPHRHEEIQANAHLIAAAPDMRKALHLWLAYNDADHDSETDMMLAYGKALEATRAALRKAEGEEE